MFYSNKAENIPGGDYECIIKYAREDITKSGYIYLKVAMVIRNDIEQNFKNRYIWNTIWKRKKQIQPMNRAADTVSFKSRRSAKLEKI